MGATHFSGPLYVAGMPTIGSPIDLFTTGNIFFVDSGTGANVNDGKTTDTPFATIDYAVGQCTANNGDTIIVFPGHVETVSAAAGLDLDVAGITILGVGKGNDRPQINFTTAIGADCDVDATDITVKNVRFTGGFDALTGPLDVNAARFRLIDCEYADVTGQCTDFLLAVDADDMLIDGLVYKGAAAAGTNAAIALDSSDRVIVRNVIMDGNFAVAGIDFRTAASTDAQIYNARFRTRNAADIFVKDTITASTGMVGPNLYLRLQDNAANITESITGATFVVVDPVYVVNLAGEKAMLINWTESTDV